MDQFYEAAGNNAARAGSSKSPCRRGGFILLRRKLFFLTAVLCLSAHCLNVQAQTGSWVRQRTGTLAWLHSIFFLNQDRGWVVGSKGTLLATVDGGKSWQIQAHPSADVLRDIYFSDEENGWLLCERNEYELKSKDDPRT